MSECSYKELRQRAFQESLQAVRSEILDYALDKGTAKACRKYDVSPTTIHRWRKIHGRQQEGKIGRPKRLNLEEQEALAKAAAADGIRIAAEDFGVSNAYASIVRRKFGYPPLHRNRIKLTHEERCARILEQGSED